LSFICEQARWLRWPGSTAAERASSEFRCSSPRFRHRGTPQRRFTIGLPWCT